MLDERNVIPYVRARLNEFRGPTRVTALGGGVSNTVLLVESESVRVIVKQSLAKLRVEEDWFSDRERIFRESAAMRMLEKLLPERSVPQVLFEDPENFAFAMTAAPAESEMWKTLLLRGEISLEIAGQAGRMLGAMIARTHRNDEFQRTFGDQTVFDQLRIDPYYRTTARRHAELADAFDRLIRESGERRVSLVHGDWSPKNLLVSGQRVTAIDFEVAHFGDPSFDAAFLLNHLLIKSVYRAQWKHAYRRAALLFWDVLSDALPEGFDWFEAATVRHLGGLLLARIDGKSPVEYVKDEEMKEQLRGIARTILLEQPAKVSEVFV